MVLTRQEKKDLVLSLYNQDKTYREIAEEVRMSPRDIGIIVNKAISEKESEIEAKEYQKSTTEKKVREQELSLSTRAYKLFSKGKTPVEVAIALNLTESEVTNYYKEYWKLKHFHSFYQIYKEVKDDIRSLVKLHRKMKAASMGMEQVVNLLQIANGDLPTVEQKYQKLKREVNLMEIRKSKLGKILQNRESRIAVANRTLKSLRMSRQGEQAQTDYLQWEIVRLRRLTERYKDNDEEYLKIKKAVEQEVSRLLQDGTQLLRLALHSLMETIRQDPEKYNNLIYYKAAPSIASYRSIPYSFSNASRQLKYPSYDSFFEGYKAMVINEAEKLYKKLVKEWTDRTILNYISTN